MNLITPGNKILVPDSGGSLLRQWRNRGEDRRRAEIHNYLFGDDKPDLRILSQKQNKTYQQWQRHFERERNLDIQFASRRWENEKFHLRPELFPSHHATTFTPTLFTFTTVTAVASLATSVTPSTTVTLDLTTKFGARLYSMIGRNAATALTRAAYFGNRYSFNSSSTIRFPQNPYDFISAIATVNATTVGAGGWAAGATAALLTSGTGFAAQQTCLAQLAAARPEFFGITNLTTNTVTLDDSGGFLVTHNAADTVTNGADCGVTWLPGGDVWRLTPINNSGQTVIMAQYVEVYASDTGT